MARETTKLRREIIAVQIPDGTLCFLPQDTEGTINYTLSGAYMVTAAGLSYRIANQDADALGKKPLVFTLDTQSNLPLEDKAWNILRTCFDPEIPVNIVDLGLIYTVEVQAQVEDKNLIKITMTLTAPTCSMGPLIVEDVKNKILSLPEVQDVTVEIVFDPPWDRCMMSEQAKLELGLL